MEWFLEKPREVRGKKKEGDRVYWGLVASATTAGFAALAYLRLNFSMRPAVSMIFCFPVKKGWHWEQIST
jgi:hypothetical protein